MCIKIQKLKFHLFLYFLSFLVFYISLFLSLSLSYTHTHKPPLPCSSLPHLIRRYRVSHHTTNQTCSGHPPKMTPRTVCCLHKLALKNRWASASDLAQVLSVESRVSVTMQTVQRTLHNIDLYGWHAKLNFATEHEQSILGAQSLVR
uniref:Transposase Tc1-like domain-containing protein n=1 Tax=Monopterus albus TaxID=43700 RepID=A0A3Q3ID80_MONAL